MQKYFAKKVECDGHQFDSRQERDRYKRLRLMEEAGEIEHLQLQKEFEIIPTLYREVTVEMKTKTKRVLRVEEKKAVYTCDFFYHDITNDTWVIEEYKSPMTAHLPDYVLRRKLIKRLVDQWNHGGRGQFVFREIIGGKEHKKGK